MIGVTALLVLVVLASGCGGSSPAQRNPTGTSSTTAASGPGGSSGPEVTAPGAGHAVTGSSSPPGPAATTGSGLAGGAEAADARQALDGWLAALGRRDATTMLADSTGAAAALGSLNLVAQQDIVSRGGNTALQVTNETLAPTTVTATVVRFTGEIDVRSTVTGPKGTAPSQDRITGPIVVVGDGGTWKLATLTFDGKPIVYYPEGSTQTVSGLHLTVVSILSYVGDTTALVDVHADTANASVTWERLSLTTGNGSTISGSAVFPTHSPTGLFRFARTNDRPAHLDATFQQHNGPTVTFSLTLPGQPS